MSARNLQIVSFNRGDVVTGPFVTFPISPSTEGDSHSAKGSRPTRAKMVALFTRIAANAAALMELDALPKVEFEIFCSCFSGGLVNIARECFTG